MVIYLHYTRRGSCYTGNYWKLFFTSNISYNSRQKLQQVNSYLLVEVLHGPFSGGGRTAALNTIRIIWYFHLGKINNSKIKEIRI